VSTAVSNVQSGVTEVKTGVTELKTDNRQKNSGGKLMQFIYVLVPKCCPPNGIISNAENFEHMYQPLKENGRCSVLFKDYLFLFSISRFLCLYAYLHNFRLFDLNIRQRATSQHTVNANEICTMHSRGHPDSEYDMLGKALRVTNKVAHSLTHENALGLYVSTHT